MGRPTVLRAGVKAVLGGAMACVVLACGEMLLWAVDVPEQGMYDGDPAFSWTLRADLDRDVAGPEGIFRVRTNALGLRGALPPQEGPWTLIVGCSTTFGWGVEEHEAWPARLQERTGSPVVNGGVPGWSSLQALRGIDRLAELSPSRVILALGVRDAWPAARPDSAATPTPLLLATRLARLIRSGRTDVRGQPSVPSDAQWQSGPWRVSPEEFRDNMRALGDRFGDAEVVRMWFPQQRSRDRWREALRELGPVLEPAMPSDAFFASDPIHLTPEGHERLSEAVAAALHPGPAEAGVDTSLRSP